MKQIRYIKTAIVALLGVVVLASCMDDDWKEPASSTSPYGNNAIQETNVISIADLKTKYASTLKNQNDTVKITESLQIKGRVTGNDIGGNIYNEVAIDDGTAAILVCISQGGLFGYLPVGQEILIELKDLYIGTYGYQPQIGMPYTNKSGRTFPSRMSRTIWQEHFKLIGTADASKVVPDTFDIEMLGTSTSAKEYMSENCGKLMTVKGVKLSEADGKKTFAPEADKDAGNGVSRKVNGKSNLVVRSSSYADFAATVMPTETVDITGIFTRYGTTWQILMRTESDCVISQ